MSTVKSFSPQKVLNKLLISANRFADKVKDNRKLLAFCIISTFIWGLIAHAYMFFHSSFSHDSLNEFNADVYGNTWKIRLGRVFVPTYHMLTRGDLALPWLIGMLSLLYVGLAVFLVVKIFDIKSKVLTALIAGIFTVNLTVTALTATYIQDLDCNMLALLLAVLSVYLWKRLKWGFLYGIVPLCLALGLYQSFVSVAITLIMISLLMRLLHGKRAKEIIFDGLKGAGMLIGGGVAYGISIKAVCTVTGISLISGTYNSVKNIFNLSFSTAFDRIIGCYKTAVKAILMTVSIYETKTVAVISIVLFALCGILVIIKLFSKKIRLFEKLITVLLIALLPIGMNFSYVLAGYSYDLMHYGLWLSYFFAALVSFRVIKLLPKLPDIVKYGQRAVMVGLVFVLLWGNILNSNAVYLKKDLEDKANLSLFTRIVYKIESCDDYVAKETPIVFIGKPGNALSAIDGFKKAYAVAGASSPYVVGMAERSYYESYFENILLTPIKLAEEEAWEELEKDNTVEKMPCYPEDGCIQMVDGIMVVKLGKTQQERQ